MAVMIRTGGLAKSFGTTRALDGVDLEVEGGSVLGLLGPNGAGKTTAVRILATLLAPTAGHAQVGGYDVVRHPHQVRQLIGLAGQYAAVDENISGTENLSMLGRLLGLGKAPAARRAAELLDRFELADAGGRMVKTYSGGCGGAWTWRPAWSAGRRCCSWTSRPAGWTRAAATACGHRSASWSAKGRPCC
jgi:oleandomycin transport system ATP-binding protein